MEVHPLSVKVEGPGSGCAQTREYLQERAFACAIRTDQRENLAMGEIQMGNGEQRLPVGLDA